jgi:hypothetical protein
MRVWASSSEAKELRRWTMEGRCPPIWAMWAARYGRYGRADRSSSGSGPVVSGPEYLCSAPRAMDCGLDVARRLRHDLGDRAPVGAHPAGDLDGRPHEADGRAGPQPLRRRPPVGHGLDVLVEPEGA